MIITPSTLTQKQPHTLLLHAANIIAGKIKPFLRDDPNKITVMRTDLNEAMETAFAAKSDTGLWSQRQSFEALEIAQVLALQALPQSIYGDTQQFLTLLLDLCAQLPTATVRSETQIRFEQFSTPVPLGFAAGILAHINSSDIVLEPSAGTGLLAVQGFIQKARLQLNEFEQERALLLASLFPECTITRHDGEIIDLTLQAEEAPTVVLMNPPFSRNSAGTYDPYTAARHIAASLKLLATGGRCVAIVPDSFHDQNHKRAFATLGNIATLRACIGLAPNLFAKHGTSVDARILIFDKGHCDAAVLRHEQSTLQELIDLAPILPRLVSAERPGSLVGKHRPLTFLTRKAPQHNQIPKKPASIPIATVHPDIVPLDYDVLETPKPAGAVIGQYQPYSLSRLTIPEAKDHPETLVESLAMASVAAPKARYRPLLPKRLVTEGILSAPQLETVIHAGDAHGRWINEDNTGCRMGYMLGDGTGCGKGRQAAAILLDNWLQGRRRALWISENAMLIEDARRDWQAVGGLALDILPQSQWKLQEPITVSEGILFTTYATLRSNKDGRSRLDQLLYWLGADFDGVIIFDEAHAMANAAPASNGERKASPSQQGIAGLSLQQKLPKARVLYVSATGATRIDNLAYADRLGLWGAHTAFATRDIFIRDMTEGGLAALELVARDLKADGLYAARALSYAGIEYEVLEHTLTRQQIAAYDAYAAAWAIIHRNLDQVLETTNVVDGMTGKTLNAFAKGAALSQFESTKQRFFGQLLNGVKTPSLIKAIREDLAEGRAVVVQLVSTAEAMLNRRLDQLCDEDRAELAIDLSPREYVMDYLESAFPVAQMQIITDDKGNSHSVPATDEQGHPLLSDTALALRDEMLEQLCALPPVPVALDEIIRAFGKEAVAEVTGRSRRLIHYPGGTQKLERRSKNANIADTQAFMRGHKNILVFSNAGGTGRSYHADLSQANQKRRTHYLLEPGWRADRAIQGLGRTHRTHQASAPLFRPVTTDCKGERRFISTIARRLDSLGAITRGQRQTGGQNLFNPADNLESDIAKESLVRWFKLLHAGKIDCITLTDFERMTGLSLTEQGNLRQKLPPIHRFLNRLLALPIALQNALFESFEQVIAARTQAAIDAGTLDVGVEDIRAEKLEILSDQLLRSDPRTGAESRLLEIVITHKRKTISLETLLSRNDAADMTPMLNKRSQKVCLKAPAWKSLGDDGETTQVYSLLRPTGIEQMRESALLESHWQEIDLASIKAKWADEIAEALENPKEMRQHIVTGTLLPIWHLLKEANPTVYRLTAEGIDPILGRVVSQKQLPGLTQSLGINADVRLTAEEILTLVVKEKQQLQFAHHDKLVLKKSLVQGAWRLEITGVAPERLARFKAQGCFTEIIQWTTRLFIPDDKANIVINSLLEDHVISFDLAMAA